MNSSTSAVRVALVGAGYVASRHLIALADLPFVQVVAISDLDQSRASALAAKHDIPAVFSSSTEMLVQTRPQVVHILTPPASHCTLALEAMAAGCHVFVEKPMAESAEECDHMIAAAKASGRTLGVNHSARFEPPVLTALEHLHRGDIGKVIAVHHFRGSDYPPYAGGPVPSVFRQGSYPLRDLGVHAFYLLEAFAGEATSLDVRYWNGGRDPMLSFDEWRMRAEFPGASGEAVLSWNMQPVENSLWIHGTRGTLHVDCFRQSCEWYKTYPGPKQLHALLNAFHHGRRRLFSVPSYLVRVLTGKAKPSPGIYNAVQAFHRALANGEPTPVPGEEGRRAIAWVAAAGAAADAEKDRIEEERKTVALPPARILVTGAGGFLGSALVRRLIAQGETPRVFLRRPASPNSAAEGLPAVLGSLGEPDAVDRAVQGVEVVYHVGAAMKGWREDFQAGTIWGTRNVVESCLRHGVRRLVYVSSLGIVDHAGHPSGKPVNEQAPLEPNPNERGAYTQSKLEAEALVREAIHKRGLEAVIIRPGQIFGPGAEQIPPNGVLKIAGQWLVAGNGNRMLPLVFVEDVVDGLLAAAERPQAAGETIHLIDPTPVSQNEYLSACRTALGRTPVRYIPLWFFMTAAWGIELLGKILKRSVPLSRYKIRALRPLSPIDSSHAARVLDWKPRVGSRDGLAQTFSRKTS